MAGIAPSRHNHVSQQQNLPPARVTDDAKASATAHISFGDLGGSRRPAADARRTLHFSTRIPFMSTVIEQALCEPEDLLTMPDGDSFELVDGQLVGRKMSKWSSYVVLRENDELDAENVIPGFRCRVADLFLPAS
jgi:hypothetical protein